MSSILPYTRITLLIPTQLYFNYAFYLKTNPYKHIMSPKSDHQKTLSGQVSYYLMQKLLCFIREIMVSMHKIFAKTRKAALQTLGYHSPPAPDLKRVENSGDFSILNVLLGMWCNQFRPPELTGEATMVRSTVVTA